MYSMRTSSLENRIDTCSHMQSRFPSRTVYTNIKTWLSQNFEPHMNWHRQIFGPCMYCIIARVGVIWQNELSVDMSCYVVRERWKIASCLVFCFWKT